MRNKKTEITIETRELTVLRWVEKEIRGFCPECGRERLFILPERAAMETGASVREIFRAVEAGAVHFIETETRLTLVCRASLAVDEQPDAQQIPALLTEVAARLRRDETIER